tara:strand:+ start:1960 stop:2364 length:405 start_codon:yes stop_codon:yes gene_type:complete
MRKLLLVGTCLLTLSACMNNQTGGALLGGGAGGLLGNTIGKGSGRTAAIIGGTLLGSIAGANVGANMDRSRTVVIQQPPAAAPRAQGYVYSECAHIGNSGVRASCERGVSERNRAAQHQAERRAYQCSRNGRCN